MSELLSGLVQGFTKAQQDTFAQEQSKELRKLQVKMFQRQLDMEDQKSAAQSKLMELLAPLGVTSQMGDFAENSGASMGTMPGKKLQDVLGTGEGQSAALGAGYKLDDIRQFQQPGIAEILAGLQMPQGGAQPGAPGGFEMTGFKISPDGQLMPDFSRNEVKRWVMSPDGKEEIGLDALGREITKRPAPADKENKITPEQGGRISMLEQGIGDIDTATKLFFPDGQQLDKTVLFQMQAPGGGIGKGREAWTLMQNAVAAKLRLETGATAPANEVRDIAQRFVPSPLDLSKPGLAQEKMKRLREFMTSTLDVSTLPPDTRKRVEERIKGRAGQSPASSNTVDFSSLPP